MHIANLQSGGGRGLRLRGGSGGSSKQDGNDGTRGDRTEGGRGGKGGRGGGGIVVSSSKSHMQGKKEEERGIRWVIRIILRQTA